MSDLEILEKLEKKLNVKFEEIEINAKDKNSFEKLECDKRIVVEGSVTVSYDYLLNLESMGKETFIPEVIKKEYSVKEFLGMVDLNEEKKENLMDKVDKIVDIDKFDFYGIKVNIKELGKAIFKFFKK